MPALVYTSANFPFTPFTKIYSADVNTCFVDIRTLLNTTGLDDTNLQNAGITRATKLKTGTAGYVLINHASTGVMSEEQYLGMSRGGMGINTTPAGVSDAGKVLAVTAAGTGYEITDAITAPAPLKIFNFYRFG